MSDALIIQSTIDQVCRELGTLQGKLFAVETEAESLRAQIQRLDTVYQNLQGQAHQLVAVNNPAVRHISLEEAIEILRDKLPVLDPASQSVCVRILNLFAANHESQIDGINKMAIAWMESHAWKQGEAIALAQKVVQCLRS